MNKEGWCVTDTHPLKMQSNLDAMADDNDDNAIIIKWWAEIDADIAFGLAEQFPMHGSLKRRKD